MSPVIAAVALAAARPTDVIVLATVAVGAIMAIAGLASFDPRVRVRLPIAVLARGNVLVAAGLVLAGVLLIGVALGLGE